jgi:hypothetical protein
MHTTASPHTATTAGGDPFVATTQLAVMAMVMVMAMAMVMVMVMVMVVVGV